MRLLIYRHYKAKGERTVTNTEKLQQVIDESENIVFFGGAGVSTESGIPDFRSQDGLYNLHYKYPPEHIISHSFFVSNAEEFYRFYKDRMIYPSAQPGAAHKYLAELERAGKLKAVVTQNIDGLHQAAGSKNVYELHGSVLRNYCTRCGKFYPVSYIAESAGVPRCDCGGLIKPDVVLYEEGLDGEIMDAAVKAISEADTLIIGGTSLVVYPAAGFISFFRGKNLVVINKTPTPADSRATLVINAPIGEVFSRLKV
jgi:NAD-dependent deacetylase